MPMSVKNDVSGENIFAFFFNMLNMYARKLFSVSRWKSGFMPTYVIGLPRMFPMNGYNCCGLRFDSLSQS